MSATATLWAISDLHVGYAENRAIVDRLRPDSPDDWLIVAGDVAEHVADVEWTLASSRERFARSSGCPATTSCGPTRPTRCRLRGEARYQRLVEVCRGIGVLTPEDPYPVLTGRGRAGHHRAAVPAVRLLVPRAGHDRRGGAGAGVPGRHRLHRRVPAPPGPVPEPGRPGAGPGWSRPSAGWPPATRRSRPSWSTTTRWSASRPGCCATPSSPSGAAPTGRPTGTCGSGPRRWSTATCTSPRDHLARRRAASWRCRWATRGSGGRRAGAADRHPAHPRPGLNPAPSDAAPSRRDHELTS